MMYENISVIVPIGSGSVDLEILKHLDGMDYPKDKIEIILAVGKWPTAQRNLAAEAAKGDILYFFNNDAQIDKDAFKKAACVINSDIRIAGIGGPDLTPPDNNYMQHLFGYAMGSYFAHWKMRARYSRIGKQRVTDEKELLLSNIAVRKDIFLKAGSFNEKLYPNEENELINRLRNMGYIFKYSPDLKIYRDRRKTLFAFMKQFYRYGEGRMNQIFIEGPLKNLQFFIPVFLPAYFLILPFINNFWLKLGPVFFYIFFSVLDASYISIRNKKNLIFVLPLIYLVMHMSYASGMLFTAFKKIPFLNPGIKKQAPVKIIRVKELLV